MIKKPFDFKTIKRISVALLALSMLAIFCACGITSTSFNFEQSGKNVPGWTTYNYESEYASAKYTTFETVTSGYNGTRSVKIESNGLNDARIYKKLKFNKNTTYEISYYVKTEDVVGGAGANISGYNCQGTAGNLYGTNDWRQVVVYFTTKDDDRVVELSLGLGGYGAESSGTVYFDDLSIKRVASAPAGADILNLSETSSKSEGKETPIWFKLLFAVLMVGGVVFVFALTRRADKEELKNNGTMSQEIGHFKKKDVIIVVLMTIITGVFSFWNLGSFNGTPNTYWVGGESGEYVTVKFKEETTVSRLVYYTGISSGKGGVEFQYKTSEGEYKKISSISSSDVEFYKWKSINSPFTTSEVRVYVTAPGIWLNEVGFYKDNSGTLEKVEIDTSSVVTSYTEKENCGKAEYLFDEQDTVRPYKTMYDSTYFDEIYFPRTAYEMRNGRSIYETTHPPLGKVIMALGVSIFGMNTVGWRFTGTLFGVLLVPLMYAFALKIFKKRQWAFLAGFLIMFDFMRLAQTRLATIDSYSCFFSFAMLYFMYDYFMVKSYDLKIKKSLVPLALSGLMFGLGAASKWTCIYTGGALAIIFFMAKLCEYLDLREKASGVYAKKWLKDNFMVTCLACVFFFIVVPATIYILSYIPYMASNPDKSLLQIVIANQKYMYNYHSNLNAEHSFGSLWYTWPWMVRPIWYYVNSASASGMRETIVSMGNPAIWWIGVPAMFGGAYLSWRNRDKRMGLVVIAYLMQYGPWILVSRVCFIYHYFSSIPFTILMIVYVIKELVEKKIVPKWVVIVYMAIVLALFVMFYPVLTGNPVKAEFVEKLKWFSTWYF